MSIKWIKTNSGLIKSIGETMFKCICQECGEEFECNEVGAKLCDDCLEEADFEYEDSEYEE